MQPTAAVLAALASLAGALALAPVAQAQAPLQPVISVARLGEGEGGFGTGLLTEARFGEAVAHLGDLDGDGVSDLAVGATGSTTMDAGDPQEGAVWILFLAPDGTVKSRQLIGQGQGGFGGALDEDDDFGSAVACLGDVDGDGVVELAVGAARDDDGGTNRGAVWILFLRPDGTVKDQAKIGDAAPDFAGQLANQDRFGFAVAALGDFDGDGVPDLAAGAERADDGGLDAGALWVLLLAPDGSVRQHQRISATAGGFTGALAAGDRFGSALAALGDHDGDGVGDLAVGSPLALDAGDEASGAVWILFLAADATVQGHVRISDGGGGFGGTVNAGQSFGRALAAFGDHDGDGIGDLAVGEPQQPGLKGRVWLLLLRPDGSVREQWRIQDGPSIDLPGPPLANTGLFGAALAALGDHDGDGRLDLAVGSPQDDLGPAPPWDRGRVRVLFLGQQDAHLPVVQVVEQGNQLGATGLATDAHPSEDADDSGLLEAGEDLNGNGLLDTDAGLVDVALEIGAVDLQITVEPFESGAPEVPFRLDVIDDGALAAGTVAARDGVGNVEKLWVELQPGTLQTRIGNVIAHGTIDASTPGMEGALSQGDQFGAAVAPLGDLDGDGIPDLAVSATGDVGSSFRGAVWILFLERDGSVRARQKIGADAGGFTRQPDPLGGFGGALATLPDIDGDGVVELAVGEPHADGGGADHGAVWILFLRADGTVARAALLAESTGITGLHTSSQFGTSLAALPDLDGNGVADLAVGAPAWVPIPAKPPLPWGNVWILFLDAQGAPLGQSLLTGEAVPTDVRFGAALAALPDLDGDGTAELAAASDVFLSNESSLRVFSPGDDGVAMAEIAIGDFDALFGLPTANGGASALAPAGDVDGDGVGDLVASFESGNLPGTSGTTGSAWILLLRPDGTVRDIRPIGEGYSDFTGDLQPFGFFGDSVANLGDLDGDGCTDLAVGAPGEDQPVNDVGAVWLIHLHTVIDTRPPLVKPELVAEGTLDAFDDRPSEDVDGSEHLAPAEDTNGNERIDQDSGIGSIVLDAGASNLVLTVDAFVPGTVQARFGVKLADPTQPGTGVVLVSDVAGNVSTCTVAIPAAKSLKR